MNRIGCSGDESRLTECSFEASRPTVCSNGVGLVCSIQQENGTVGDLRLEDAIEDDYIISGRLEVFNGSWGSICWDYYFGLDEALVVCGQLGYFGPGMSCVRRHTPSLHYQQKQSITLSLCLHTLYHSVRCSIHRTVER